MSKHPIILLTVTDVVRALHIGSGQSDIQEKRLLQRFGLAPHAYTRGLSEGKPCLRPVYLEDDVRAVLEKEKIKAPEKAADEASADRITALEQQVSSTNEKLDKLLLALGEKTPQQLALG